MKKMMYTFVMIIAATVILAACGGSNNAANEGNPAPVEDTNKAPVTEALPDDSKDAGKDVDGKVDNNDDTQGTRLAGSIMTVAELESGLAIGDTQEDVNILFDSHPYQEVTAFMDGSNVWRYDFGAQAEYSHEEQSDTHDQEGILNGDVPIQVFIYFDEEGKVSAYTAYQADEAGNINVYQTLGDGTRKVDTI